MLFFDDIEIGDGCDDGEFSHISDEEMKYLIENNLTLPPKPQTLHDIFWDWFSEIETFDLESEEITEVIKTKYIASLNTEQREHLTIKRA